MINSIKNNTKNTRKHCQKPGEKKQKNKNRTHTLYNDTLHSFEADDDSNGSFDT